MLKRNILIFILGLLMLGCYPEFNSPLSDLKNSKIDERLLGTWYSTNKKELGYIHIEKGFDNSLNITLVNIDNYNLNERYTMFSTKIKNNFYMNLQDEDLEKKHRYIIVKYVINDKQELAISMLENIKVAEDIEQGILDGEVTGKGSFSKKVEVREPSSALAEYIKSNSKDIFGETLKLKKLTP
ncbi:MAG: hypothetical protein HY819_06790 [Acidobacteria bacterium]|nr:hypothetical protein [Acidobacteriota bacterium]